MYANVKLTPVVVVEIRILRIQHKRAVLATVAIVWIGDEILAHLVLTVRHAAFDKTARTVL